MDSKYMAIVLTQEGFLRWAEGKELTILDVKPEFQQAYQHEFVRRR